MSLALFPFDSSSLPLIHNDNEIFGNEIHAVFSFPEWGFCGETLSSIDHLCKKNLIVQSFTCADDLLSFDTVIICNTYLQLNVDTCIMSVIDVLLSSGIEVINLSSIFNSNWFLSTNYKSYDFTIEKISYDHFPSPICHKIAIVELSPSNNSHYIAFSLWNQLNNVNLKTALIPSFPLTSISKDIHCFNWDSIEQIPIYEYISKLSNFTEKINKNNYDIQIWELPKAFLEDGYSDIMLNTKINVKNIHPDILIVILPSEIYDRELVEKLINKTKNVFGIESVEFMLGNNFCLFDAQQDYLPIYLSRDTFEFYMQQNNKRNMNLSPIYSCLESCDFAKTLLTEICRRSENDFL